MEQFWHIYSHMVRPNDLVGHCDIHLFKESIKPMWEDDKNKMGGKWIVRLRKGQCEKEISLVDIYLDRLIMCKLRGSFSIRSYLPNLDSPKVWRHAVGKI